MNKTIKIYIFEVKKPDTIYHTTTKLHAYSIKEAKQKLADAVKVNLYKGLEIMTEPQLTKSRSSQDERSRFYNWENKLIYDFKGDRKAFTEWRRDHEIA